MKTGELRGGIRLTAGVTSATVAKKSQIRPFHGKHMSDQSRKDTSLPTCLQRIFHKPNMLPYCGMRRRPTSIMRSKTTSVTSVAVTFFLVLSVFITTQTFCAGTHAAWSCGPISRPTPKTRCGQWEYSPVWWLSKNQSHELSKTLNK